MTNTHKSTRVGDLLVEKGIITRAQLTIAIELQQNRRHEALQNSATAESKQELGELLIELGFINRNQLTSGLSLQRRLRKTTAVMVFLAPLLTAACGGGGGGSNTNPTRSSSESSLVVSSNSAIDQSSNFSSSSVVPVLSSSSGSLTSNSVANSKSSDSSLLGNNSSRSLSSAAGINYSAKSTQSSKPASSSTSSSRPASSKFSSASSSSKSTIDGPVQVYWTAPSQRENGEFLDITELGGYELRYRKKTEETFTRIIINDAYIDAYYFDSLQGEYEFQIAAFDAKGYYSSFESLFPM